ncbi:Mobile element protein [uncultured Gammaproteobacteria bacterium]|nr:Mobile element protein [uncultured Gammaproteobacteria bacterium]CAC9650846.1 Mobile element protein [uncultured Gammaproteobacteria bacterium]CAC9993761.1 Mobile element protein [uncultured Gammaproteobacteria bacterium]
MFKNLLKHRHESKKQVLLKTEWVTPLKYTHNFILKKTSKMQNIFTQALGINSPWFIKNVEFNNKQLNIHIDFKKGSKWTNGDKHTKAYSAYDTKMKTCRHMNFFEHECYLHVRVPRIKNDDGKVRIMLPPFAGELNGFTLLFEAFVIKFCKYMPVHNVCQLMNLSDYKVWKLLDIYVDEARLNQDLSGIDTFGLDETSVAKGHDYITLFVDLYKKAVVHISDGKSAKTVHDFVATLEQQNGNKEQVKAISCDMSPAFIKGVCKALPNARITFDKFHILKIINAGVDKVRKAEVKDNPILKGTRYLFLKNAQNLTKKQQDKKAELVLENYNLKSFEAMRMRETFQQIYQAPDMQTFRHLLQKWYHWVSQCSLLPMVKTANMVKRHWQGILEWKLSSINNGILEGLNSVIQAAKRKARGYGKKHFKTMAYLLSGKLDLHRINGFLPTCF